MHCRNARRAAWIRKPLILEGNQTPLWTHEATAVATAACAARRSAVDAFVSSLLHRALPNYEMGGHRRVLRRCVVNGGVPQ